MTLNDFLVTPNVKKIINRFGFNKHNFIYLCLFLLAVQNAPAFWGTELKRSCRQGAG